MVFNWGGSTHSKDTHSKVTHSKDTHSKEWKPFSTALRLGLKVLPIEKRRNVL
jgi:hypothetical protein